MWSYSVIDDIRKDAERKAKREHRKPCPVEIALEDHERSGSFTRIRFLGNYTPKGWVRLERTFFVDSTGGGRESEPALTIEQFVKELEQLKKSQDHYAVAIREQGQFQVVIGLYRPDPRDWTHTGELTEDELNRR